MEKEIHLQATVNVSEKKKFWNHLILSTLLYFLGVNLLRPHDCICSTDALEM